MDGFGLLASFFLSRVDPRSFLGVAENVKRERLAESPSVELAESCTQRYQRLGVNVPVTVAYNQWTKFEEFRSSHKLH
jgi:hypothetical protein